MIRTNFIYNAFVTKVIDGDTFEAHVITSDLGFNNYTMSILRFRLKNIDTWEKFAINDDIEHKEKGLLAKKRAEELILYRWVILESHKSGKYGRWLVTVQLEDGRMLAEILKEEGHEKYVV